MLVLTSEAATAEARLLQQRGLRTRSAPPGAMSDLLLTTPKGAFAFLLLRGDDTRAATARATAASRAARRCTLLWIGESVSHGAVEALQWDWCARHFAPGTERSSNTRRPERARPSRRLPTAAKQTAPCT